LITKVHAEIKKKPEFVKVAKKTFTAAQRKEKKNIGNIRKLTKEQRDKAVKKKIKQIFKGKN